MNRLIVILIAIAMLFSGCAKEEEPAEPTPDLQLQMQTRIDMGQWMLTLRYVKTMCAKAAGAIEKVFDPQNEEQSRLAAAAAIEHFNETDGLIHRLKLRADQAEAVQKRLADVVEKDERIYKSLEKGNTLISQYLDLISTLPETPAQFSEEQERLNEQLDSIFKVLAPEYPENSDDLAAMMSDDNLDYRAEMKAIQEIPTPQPMFTATPEVELPTPTPTLPPARTWVDKDGVMHMGHHPPDDANLHEIRSQLSGAVETTTAAPPEEDTGEATESKIWVDDQGVTHMGGEAPEGVETRDAKDITLMIE